MRGHREYAELYLPVFFPEKEIYCRNCILMREGRTRNYCSITQEPLNEIYEVGGFCPLKDKEEHEHESKTDIL